MTEASAATAIARLRPSGLSFALVLAAAVGIPLALMAWAGWREVLAAAAAIGALAVSGALATSLANYRLRFTRWQRFTLALGHQVPWRRNLTIYLSGLALTATPGKSGELVRALFLKPYGVPYARTFVLFYWDRLSDLAGVLLLAVGAGGLLTSGYRPLVPGVLLVLGLLWLLRPGGSAFSRGLFLVEAILPRRLRPHVRGLTRLRHADSRLTPGLAARGVGTGAAAYGAHGVGLYLLAHALGVPLDLAGAVLIAAVSTLMGAAVLVPGGLGMVEMTSVALLTAQGVPAPEAVALGLVHRLGTFWFAIGLGTGCLIVLLRGRGDARA